MSLPEEDRDLGRSDGRPPEILGILTWPTAKEWGAMIKLSTLGDIAEDRFYVIATTILLFLAVVAACSLAIARVPTTQATAIMGPIMGFVALLIYQYRSNFSMRQRTAEAAHEIKAVRQEITSNRIVASATADDVKDRLDRVNREQFNVLDEIREAGQRTLQLVDLHQQGCLATLARVTQTMASLTGDPEDQRMADAAHRELATYLAKAESIRQAVVRSRKQAQQANQVHQVESPRQAPQPEVKPTPPVELAQHDQSPPSEDGLSSECCGS